MAGGPATDGVVLLTPDNGAPPDGPLIVTPAGEPVWIHPIAGKQVTNLRVGRYRDEPVLTWWEGAITKTGIGHGECVVVDASYREIARVQAGNGLEADLHEFLIGPSDTAFLLATRIVTATLPVPSGPTLGPVLEGVIQELDLVTGQVLFEWHSLPAIDPSESYAAVPTDGSPFDYLHANSLDIDGDALLLCARHTCAVYRIDRASGAITWRLNGRRSDFEVPDAARFYWQHDARRRPDGTISIFDNGANGATAPNEPRSRGLVLALAESNRTVHLVQQVAHPDEIAQTTSQGSFQVLADGGSFVGWGSTPRYTRFDRDGNVVLDGTYDAAVQSYRSLLEPWVGRPAGPPDIALDGSSGARVLYVSWNGATEVDRWEALDVDGRDHVLVAAAPAGFETALVLPSKARHVAVRAVDVSGTELGRSAVVDAA